jgi:hypothetical protein
MFHFTEGIGNSVLPPAAERSRAGGTVILNIGGSIHQVGPSSHSCPCVCPLCPYSQSSFSIQVATLTNSKLIPVQVKWETIDKFPRSRLQKLRYATSECKNGKPP